MTSFQESAPHTEDIAVIGLACRFPGGASDPSKFWDLLSQKRSAFSKVPADRYNADAFHNAGSGKQGTLRSDGAHFIEQDVSTFDAPFFNITAQEAKVIDPAARMLLEVTYEGLENAGIPIESLVGSDTSCHVGCFTHDYHDMLMRDAESAPMYSITGTGFSLLSNRVSWFYDFRGPSMTLDTACSSSLVALHLACRGLRAGESKVAVVCGANLLLSPDLGIWLANLKMASKDGLSRAFAEDVTGYGRGEGIASVILKPLADALRDGDSIRSVIRGSGVNQDGHTAGITLPNSKAQAELIRSTYRQAKLDFADTYYFEAHGTGTAAGDPLELGAVAETISAVRDPTDALYVGSVKSNIGHLEGAAGLAGVIKCILMLENESVAPNIHFDRPNKRIPFSTWKIQVPTEVIPWPRDRLMRTSVNSFGYGGTNAHVILDNAKEYLERAGLKRTIESGDDTPRSPHERLFVLSAPDESALSRTALQLGQHLSSLRFDTQAEEEAYLDRLSYTLSERRSRHVWKSFFTAPTAAQLSDQLSAETIKTLRSPDKSRLAFCFTGQGAQWARMGQDLMSYPIFRANVIEADRYLRETQGCEWSVFEELALDSTSSRMQQARFSQPLCTVLQIALVELLASWGITPTGVVGHSSGEIAAAYCYGAFSKQDSWSISYWRGKVCSELSIQRPEVKGAMMAAGLSQDEANTYIKSVTKGKINVACVNSPSSVTISGDETGIDELQTILAADSVFCRKLKVENAYHSHHMELVAEEYLQKLAHIKTLQPASTSVKMISSVTGAAIPHDQLGPEYWVKNFVSPVLFSQAVAGLMSDDSRRRRRKRAGEVAFDIVLEVGPHSTLRGPVRQILQAQDVSSVVYSSVLSRGENDVRAALSAAGDLSVQGVKVDLSALNLVNGKGLTPLIDLPTYPWNHSLKFWTESRVSQNYHNRKFARHDLLGAPVPDFDERSPRWRNFIRVSEMPWVRDHVVHGSILYPGSGFVAMVLEAARQMADPEKKIDKIELQDVRINNAIVVPDTPTGVETVLQFTQQCSRPNNSWTGRWEWTVSSGVDNGSLSENSAGIVTIHYHSSDDEAWALEHGVASEEIKEQFLAAKAVAKQQITPKAFYEATSAAGFKYGTYFQGLRHISRGKDTSYSVIQIPDTKASMPYNVESAHLIHPSTLDVVFHSIFAAVGTDEELNFENAAVPIAFDRLLFSADLPSGSGSELTGFGSVARDGTRDLLADVYMADHAWEEPKIQILGMRCRELPPNSEGASDDVKAPLGTLEWKPDILQLDSKALQSYISTQLSKPSPQQAQEEVLMNGAAIARTLEKSICAVTDLAAHKSPSWSILQIGGTEYLTQSLLTMLGTKDDSAPMRFSTYTVAHSDSEWIEQAAKWFPEGENGVTLKYFKSDAPSEAFANDSYDFIIVGRAPTGIDSKDKILALTQAALKEGGAAILGGSHYSKNSLSWAEITAASNLSMLAEVAPDPAEPSITISLVTKASTQDRSSSEAVYILEPPVASSRTQSISQHLVTSLDQYGIKAAVLPWTTDVATLQGKSLISLLELEKSMWNELDEQSFERLRTITLQSASLLWVTMGDQDPVMQAAIGYLRVLQNENANLRLRYLHLEETFADQEIACNVSKIAIAEEPEREFIQKDGALCINRWVPRTDLNGLIASKDEVEGRESVKLGDIQASLKLVHFTNGKKDVYFDLDNTFVDELGPNEVEVEVRAIAVDNLTPEEESQPDTHFKEFSGVVTKVGQACTQLKAGSRVAALGSGPYKTRLRVAESACLTIPEHLSFEESTVWALSWPTAYHALHGLGRINDQSFVVIQAAATSTGQAAVQLARQSGATVIAVVRTAEERLAVKSLGVNSRFILREGDSGLSQAISRLTGKKGANVILNLCLVGDALLPLWHSVASSGVLIDAVRGDDAAADNSSLDLGPFRRGASYSVLDMQQLIQDNSSLLKDALNALSETIVRNPPSPLSGLVTISSTDAADAVAQAQAQVGLGRVVLTLSPEDVVSVPVNVANPLVLDKNATYVLVGGLGGLGRSLARLLVSCGAKNLAFISRSGGASPNAKIIQDELAAAQITSKIYACDVADAEAMKRTIDQCADDLPPIKGVVQAAVVLNDALFENMSWDDWNQAVRPKIQGTQSLHDLLPKDLQFFAMLSSISGVIGNRGQANYSAGNTYQDGLAAHRRSQGLSAVSIDLGLMLGIGMIAERGGASNLNKWAAVALNEQMFQSLMVAVMAGSFKGTSIPTQVISGLPTAGIVHRKRLEKPFYVEDPRFALLKKLDLEGIEVAGESTVSLVSQLEQCKTLDAAGKVTTAALCEKIASGLQQSADNIDSSKPLHAYGVDSLMAVDIRTWALSEAQAEIALFEVLSGISIAALAQKIAAVSKAVLQQAE